MHCQNPSCVYAVNWPSSAIRVSGPRSQGSSPRMYSRAAGSITKNPLLIQRSAWIGFWLTLLGAAGAWRSRRRRRAA